MGQLIVILLFACLWPLLIPLIFSFFYALKKETNHLIDLGFFSLLAYIISLPCVYLSFYFFRLSLAHTYDFIGDIPGAFNTALYVLIPCFIFFGIGKLFRIGIRRRIAAQKKHANK